MNPLPSSKKFLDESNWDSLSKDQRKSEYESWKSQWMSFHDDEVMGSDGASDWLSKAESEFASVENSIQDKPKTRAFDFAGSKQFLSMGDDERKSFYDAIRKRAADDNDPKSAEEEISILEKSRLDSMFDDLIISSGLKPGLTSAMNRSFDTDEARSITKDSEGKWKFPFVNKDTREEGKFDAGDLLIVGPLFSAVDTVQQFAGNVTGFSQGEDSPIGRAVTAFQKANNISDSDMAGIWSRYSDSSRSWGENESHRVSSTGDIVFNSGNDAILDEDETNKIIDERLKEGKINNTTAEMAKKRLVYQREQAAADYMGKYSMISGYWNSGIIKAGDDLPDPIEFAQNNGFDNPVSPEAALAYKKAHADKADSTSETARSLFLSGVRGVEKVPQWLFGMVNAPFGTDFGSSWFADVAQTAENLKTKDDGIIGDIIEETPSLVVQIAAGNVAGSALARSSGVATNLQRANKVKELMAKGISQKDAVAKVGKLVSGNAQKMDMVVAAMAGTQSGGITYGQALLDGKNPSEAREDAMRAAIITSVVTFAFQKLDMGGVEDLAAGKKTSEITVGDFLGAWSKKSGVNHTVKNRAEKAAEWLMHAFKETAGEGAEEGLDEAIQAFANADKDDNLADAFTNAYIAMKTGAAIGGTVHIGTHLFSADKQLEYDSADTLAALMLGTSQTVAALREIDSQLAGDAPKTEVVETPGNVVVPKEGEEAKKPGLFKIRVSGSREVLNLPVNDTSEESVVSEIFGSPDEGKSWEGVSPENITLSKIKKGLFSVYYNGAPTTTVFDSESKTFRGIVKEDSPKLFSIVEKNGDMRLNQSAIEGFVPEKKEQQAKASVPSQKSIEEKTEMDKAKESVLKMSDEELFEAGSRPLPGSPDFVRSSAIDLLKETGRWDDNARKPLPISEWKKTSENPSGESVSITETENKQQTQKADEKEKGQEQGRQEVLTKQESSGEQSPAATTPDSDKSVEPAPVKEEKISSADSERIKMLQGEIDSGKLSPVERANKMVEIAKIQKGLQAATSKRSDTGTVFMRTSDSDPKITKGTKNGTFVVNAEDLPDGKANIGDPIITVDASNEFKDMFIVVGHSVDQIDDPTSPNGKKTVMRYVMRRYVSSDERINAAAQKLRNLENSKNIKLVRNVVNQIFKDSRNVSEDDVREMFMSAFSHVFSNEAGDVTIDFNDSIDAPLSYTAGEGSKGTINVNIASFISDVMQYSSLASTNDDFRDAVSDFVSNSIMKDMYHEIAHHYATNEFSYEEHVARGNDVISKSIINDDNIGQVSFWIRHALSSIYDKDSLDSLSDSEIIDLARGKDFSKQGFQKMDKTQLEELSWRVGHESLAYFTQLLKSGSTRYTIQEHFNALFNSVSSIKGNDKQRGTILSRLASHFSKYVKAVAGFFNAHRMIRTLPSSLVKDSMKLNSILGKAGVIEIDSEQVLADARKQFKYAMDGPARVVESNFNDFKIKKNIRELIARARRKMGKGSLPVIIDSKGKFHISKDVPEPIRKDLVANIAALNTDAMSDAYVMAQAAASDMRIVNAYLSGTHAEGDIGNSVYGENPQEEYARFVSAIGARFESDFGMSLSDLYDSLQNGDLSKSQGLFGKASSAILMSIERSDLRSAVSNLKSVIPDAVLSRIEKGLSSIERLKSYIDRLNREYAETSEDVVSDSGFAEIAGSILESSGVDNFESAIARVINTAKAQSSSQSALDTAYGKRKSIERKIRIARKALGNILKDVNSNLEWIDSNFESKMRDNPESLKTIKDEILRYKRYAKLLNIVSRIESKDPKSASIVDVINDLGVLGDKFISMIPGMDKEKIALFRRNVTKATDALDSMRRVFDSRMEIEEMFSGRPMSQRSAPVWETSSVNEASSATLLPLVSDFLSSIQGIGMHLFAGESGNKDVVSVREYEFSASGIPFTIEFPDAIDARSGYSRDVYLSELSSSILAASASSSIILGMTDDMTIPHGMSGYEYSSAIKNNASVVARRSAEKASDLYWMGFADQKLIDNAGFSSFVTADSPPIAMPEWDIDNSDKSDKTWLERMDESKELGTLLESVARFITTSGNRGLLEVAGNITPAGLAYQLVLPKFVDLVTTIINNGYRNDTIGGRFLDDKSYPHLSRFMNSDVLKDLAESASYSTIRRAASENGYEIAKRFYDLNRVAKAVNEIYRSSVAEIKSRSEVIADDFDMEMLDSRLPVDKESLLSIKFQVDWRTPWIRSEEQQSEASKAFNKRMLVGSITTTTASKFYDDLSKALKSVMLLRNDVEYVNDGLSGYETYASISHGYDDRYGILSRLIMFRDSYSAFIDKNIGNISNKDIARKINNARNKLNRLNAKIQIESKRLVDRKKERDVIPTMHKLETREVATSGYFSKTANEREFDAVSHLEQTRARILMAMFAGDMEDVIKFVNSPKFMRVGPDGTPFYNSDALDKFIFEYLEGAINEQINSGVSVKSDRKKFKYTDVINAIESSASDDVDGDISSQIGINVAKVAFSSRSVAIASPDASISDAARAMDLFNGAEVDRIGLMENLVLSIPGITIVDASANFDILQQNPNGQIEFDPEFDDENPSGEGTESVNLSVPTVHFSGGASPVIIFPFGVHAATNADLHTAISSLLLYKAKNGTPISLHARKIVDLFLTHDYPDHFSAQLPMRKFEMAKSLKNSFAQYYESKGITPPVGLDQIIDKYSIFINQVIERCTNDALSRTSSISDAIIQSVDNSSPFIPINDRMAAEILSAALLDRSFQQAIVAMAPIAYEYDTDMDIIRSKSVPGSVLEMFSEGIGKEIVGYLDSKRDSEGRLIQRAIVDDQDDAVIPNEDELKTRIDGIFGIPSESGVDNKIIDNTTFDAIENLMFLKAESANNMLAEMFDSVVRSSPDTDATPIPENKDARKLTKFEARQLIPLMNNDGYFQIESDARMMAGEIGIDFENLSTHEKLEWMAQALVDSGFRHRTSDPSMRMSKRRLSQYGLFSYGGFYRGEYWRQRRINKGSIFSAEHVLGVEPVEISEGVKSVYIGEEYTFEDFKSLVKGSENDLIVDDGFGNKVSIWDLVEKKMKDRKGAFKTAALEIEKEIIAKRKEIEEAQREIDSFSAVFPDFVGGNHIYLDSLIASGSNPGEARDMILNRIRRLSDNDAHVADVLSDAIIDDAISEMEDAASKLGIAGISRTSINREALVLKNEVRSAWKKIATLSNDVERIMNDINNMVADGTVEFDPETFGSFVNEYMSNRFSGFQRYVDSLATPGNYAISQKWLSTWKALEASVKEYNAIVDKARHHFGYKTSAYNKFGKFKITALTRGKKAIVEDFLDSIETFKRDHSRNLINATFTDASVGSVLDEMGHSFPKEIISEIRDEIVKNASNPAKAKSGVAAIIQKVLLSEYSFERDVMDIIVKERNDALEKLKEKSDIPWASVYNSIRQSVLANTTASLISQASIDEISARILRDVIYNRIHLGKMDISRMVGQAVAMKIMENRSKMNIAGSRIEGFTSLEIALADAEESEMLADVLYAYGEKWNELYEANQRPGHSDGYNEAKRLEASTDLLFMDGVSLENKRAVFDYMMVGDFLTSYDPIMTNPVPKKEGKRVSRKLAAMSFFIENGAGEFEKINGASDEDLNRMIQEHVDSKIASLKKMVENVDSNINIDKHVAVSEADVARAQADYDAALERFDNASENERVKASEAVLEARMALSVATARKADSDASAELQKPINEALSIGATDLADQFNEMFSDSDTFLHKTIQNLRDYKKVLLQQIADLEKFDVSKAVKNSKSPANDTIVGEISKTMNMIGIKTEVADKRSVRVFRPLEAASISPSRLNSVSNMARNLVHAELVPDPDSGEFAKKLYDEFMSDVETLDKALDDPDVDQGIKNTIHALFARGSRTVPSRNDNEIMSSIYNLSTQLNSDKMARERGADLWSAAERRSLISGNVKTLNYFKTGWSRLMDLKMSTKGSVLRRIFGGTRLGYVAAAHVYGIVDHGVYGRSGRNGAIRDGKMFIDRINKAAAKVKGDKSFVKSNVISALPVSASFKGKLRDDSDNGKLEKLSLGYMLAHIRTFFSDVNAPIESKAGMLLQQLDNARVGVHQALYHDIYKNGMSSSNPLHAFLGHASAIKAYLTETHFRQIRDAEVLAYVDSVVRPFLLDIQNGTTDFDQMMDHFRAQDSSITGYANELVSIFREIKQGMIFAGARVGADISRMRNMPSVPMKWGSKTTYETHNRKHVEILESISPINSSWNRFPNVKDPNKLKGNQQHYGIKLIDVNGLTGPVAIIQSALNSINVYQGYDLSIRHNGMPSEGMQEKRNDENGVPLASLYNVNSGNPVLSSNMHSMGLVLQRLIDDKMLAESNSTEGQTRARVFAQCIQKLNVVKTLFSILNIVRQPSAGAIPYSILRNRYGNKSDNFAKAVAKYISGSVSNGMNSILSVAGKSIWSGNEHSAYKDKIDAVILEYFPLITARSSDAMAETVAMAHSLSPEGKMRPEPRMLPKGSALGKWMKVPSKASRVAAGSLIATGDKAMQVTYADAESHVIRPMVVFEYVTQYNWVRKPTTPLTVDEFISNPDKYIHPALATLAVTEIDSLFGTTDPAERGSFFRPTGTVTDMIVMGMIRKLATTTMALASGARADVHNMIDGDMEMKKDALRNFSSILMQNLVFAAFAGNVLAYMVSKVLPYITLASKDEREKISQSFLRWFHGIDEEGNNEGIGWLKRAIFDLGKNPIGFDTRIGKFTEAEEAKDVKDFFKRLAMDQTMLVPGVGQISLIPPAKLGTQFIYNSTVGRAYFGERGGLDFIQSGIGGAEWQNSDDPNKVMIYNVSMILREFLRMSYITDSMAGFADPLILETTNETDAEMIDLVARYLTEITPMPRSTKREIIQNMEKEQKIQKYHKPEKRTSLK